MDSVSPDALSDGLDLEDAELEDLNEVDPQPEPIGYSGTDFDVEGLVRRLKRGDIVIPSFGENDSFETEGFQRRFVWKSAQMDRFIESMLLGYPIPGIFLVQQADKRYLVLDGQQRLKTMAAFYDGVHAGKVFALANVGDEFRGLTYADLSDEQRRTLDNTFIQATIVRTDGSLESLDAVYQVFERLNSGGTQLTAHEIRVALYSGPFIHFLSDLNANPAWRSLYGPESPRLRDQELILRVIALYVAPGSYKRPLKKFLNDFAASSRSLRNFDPGLVSARFINATELLASPEGPQRAALRSGSSQVNAALAETVLVGLFRRLDAGGTVTPEAVAGAVRDLLADPDLTPVISRATADEEAVRARLAIGTRVFARI